MFNSLPVGLYFRMGNRQKPVEDRRRTINHVHLAEYQTLLNPFNALEPYQFHHPDVLSQAGNKTLRTVFAQHRSIDKSTDKLHPLSTRINLVDLMKNALINITKRIIMKKITERKYPEIFVQYLGPMGAYTLKISDRGFK